MDKFIRLHEVEDDAPILVNVSQLYFVFDCDDVRIVVCNDQRNFFRLFRSFAFYVKESLGEIENMLNEK